MCPRAFCDGERVLPVRTRTRRAGGPSVRRADCVGCAQVGLSDQLQVSGVHVFCPRCRDVYKVPDQQLDGAYFGCSFAHILLMSRPPEVYGPVDSYVPRVYGFRVRDRRAEAAAGARGGGDDSGGCAAGGGGGGVGGDGDGDGGAYGAVGGGGGGAAWRRGGVPDPRRAEANDDSDTTQSSNVEGRAMLAATARAAAGAEGAALDAAAAWAEGAALDAPMAAAEGSDMHQGRPRDAPNGGAGNRKRRKMAL